MTKFLSVAVILGAAFSLSIESVGVELAPGRPGCAYADAPQEGIEIDLTRRDPEFERNVSELLQAFGLFGSSIKLLPSTDRYRGVAEARISLADGAPLKVLIYNPDAVSLRGRRLNTLWPAYAIAAHEIGHLINDHVVRAQTTDLERKNWELIADRASGFALRVLGASLRDALDTLRHELGESPLHPPKVERLAAIREGWSTADLRLQRATGQPFVRFTSQQLLFSVAVTLYDGSDALPDGLPAQVEIALFDRDGQRLDGTFDDPTPVHWKHVGSFPSIEAQIKKLPPNPRVHFDASDFRLLERVELRVTAPPSAPWPNTTAQRRLDASCLRGFLKIEALDAGGNRIALVETGFESICWQWPPNVTVTAPPMIGQEIRLGYRNLRWHDGFWKAAGLVR